MSKFLNAIERLAKIVRPWVIRPFYAIIGVGLLALGSSILLTNEGAIWQFLNCFANNYEKFGDGLDEICPFPPIGELTTDDVALAFGFIFVVMAFIMGTLALLILLKGEQPPPPPTEPEDDPKPHTLVLPGYDAYLHDIVTRQLAGSDSELKRTNLSREDYEQLIVMTGTQPGKYATELELIKHLLTRLRPHDFGDLELTQEGENYRLTATPEEQGETESE